MAQFPDPLVLANLHQKNMLDLVSKIRADAGCVRQLLVGRKVRRKSDGLEFMVKEARLGLSSHISLFGRRADARSNQQNRRTVRIGLVSDIDLVEAP